MKFRTRSQTVEVFQFMGTVADAPAWLKQPGCSLSLATNSKARLSNRNGVIHVDRTDVLVLYPGNHIEVVRAGDFDLLFEPLGDQNDEPADPDSPDVPADEAADGDDDEDGESGGDDGDGSGVAGSVDGMRGDAADDAERGG